MNKADAEKQQQFVTLQVVTTSGNYPTDGFQRYNEHEKLSTVLHEAARELRLRNTDGWLAMIGDRQLDPSKSIAENGLTDATRIQWAPVERGGGACTRR